MEIRDYLKDELKRLNRLNDKLEKDINKKEFSIKENELIINNTLAMCEIAKAYNPNI